MQRLLLVRHAHSQHHEQGLTGGWTDSPLSQRGHRQAQLLAARCRQLMTDEPAVAVVSSDLARAAQTAAYIAQGLQVDVHFEPALRELNNGAAAGLSQAEAARIELPLSEPTVDWLPYPGAESWRMLQARIWTGMDQIARRSLYAMALALQRDVRRKCAEFLSCVYKRSCGQRHRRCRRERQGPGRPPMPGVGAAGVARVSSVASPTHSWYPARDGG